MLSSKYNAHELEQRVQGQWYSASNSIFHWSGAKKERDENFVIDTPPPTVSGALHIGHVFSYTQTDFIARFWRMMGKDVFYPIGFDDNGLPSERLVEKVNKVRAFEMKRSEFQDLCRKTIVKYEAEFEELFKQCGISFDWRYKYQTVSAESITLSQMSFLDLHNKGDILREKAPTFWDWVDQTAIAQAEIEDKTRESVMNYIHFEVVDSAKSAAESAVIPDASAAHGEAFGSAHGATETSTTSGTEKIEIATTRPELLPACSAVFYHPHDSRYKGLAGKFAVAPLFGGTVPILPDEDVEMEKGSGLVMCCTYGDFQDVVWQKRHNLKVHECVGFNGRMKNAGALDNMKIKAARACAIELLQQGGFLQKQVAITQTVKCAERSGEVLEILNTSQWYIKLLPHKKELHKQINKCKWYPDFMKQRAEIWNENLNQNWCISRQRYFGVPIPVWYSKRKGEEGKIILPELADLPVDPIHDLPKGYSADEVMGEQDVLGTWATSSITPSLSSGIINNKYYVKGYRALDESMQATDNANNAVNGNANASGAQEAGSANTAESIDVSARMEQLTPCDLRPQSHEIIRTWAYCTIAKSWLHNNTIPWRELAISGWCLARDNSKMSKSKGNVMDPKKLLNEYGADAVRYWASTSKLGVDIAFSEDTLKVGRKLTKKLWNASKFVASQLESAGFGITTSSINIEELVGTKGTAEGEELDGHAKIFESFDLWIIAKLRHVIKEATSLLNGHDFSAARSKIEDFFWNDFCDNYLEIVKKRSYGNGSSAHESGAGTSDDAVTTDANTSAGDGSLSDGTSGSSAVGAPEVSAARKSALYTMQYCLSALLRLFMPYIPHITTEIYSSMFNDVDAHRTFPAWPQERECYTNEAVITKGELAVSVVEAVRREKTTQRAAMNAPVSNLHYYLNGKVLEESFERDIKDVTNSTNISAQATPFEGNGTQIAQIELAHNSSNSNGNTAEG